MFGKKEKPAKREGFIKRLRARINRGDSWLTYDLANLVPGGKIDEDSLDELESLLVMADVGIDTTTRIIGDLQKSLARKELTDLDSLRRGLHRSLVDILGPVEQPLDIGTEHRPFVILMVGVNGAGKTTTIGKLAKRLQDQGLSVMLAAGDTFRAAAVEQLQAWGERNDVPVVAQQSGADPAAVIFDAWEARRHVTSTCCSPIRQAACRTSRASWTNWPRSSASSRARTKPRRTRSCWCSMRARARTRWCRRRSFTMRSALPASP